MCGRYAAKKDPATLMDEFDAFDQLDDPPPADYNVAPTKNVVTVVQRHPRDADDEVLRDEPAVRSLRVMRWGLVPSWAKDASGGGRLINTRVETAAEKPSFRRALTRRRCLVPADGWYEWQRDGKEKRPFYMTGPTDASLALAGIWESWRDPKDADAKPLLTFSVLTTDAVGQLTEIHHRMPLLMPPEHWAGWLDPDREDATGLLAPPPLEVVDALELRPVSDRVNSVRNNGPELVERVDPAQQADPADEGALFRLPSS